MKTTKSADDYYKNTQFFGPQLCRLRTVLQSTELKEEIKWGMPCYTVDGKNIVGVSEFKSYFGLWFHQGALLGDIENVLINAQEGKTKALRQWRMHTAADIRPAIIKRYIKEAIALAKAGKEIAADRNNPLAIPAPLKKALTVNAKAGAAFKKLTPGLKREYADYITEAKRDDTKARRIEKILPMIAAGKGLNDKYR